MVQERNEDKWLWNQAVFYNLKLIRGRVGSMINEEEKIVLVLHIILKQTKCDTLSKTQRLVNCVELLLSSNVYGNFFSALSHVCRDFTLQVKGLRLKSGWPMMLKVPKAWLEQEGTQGRKRRPLVSCLWAVLANCSLSIWEKVKANLLHWCR